MMHQEHRVLLLLLVAGLTMRLALKYRGPDLAQGRYQAEPLRNTTASK
jgi:hypothetical protein